MVLFFYENRYLQFDVFMRPLIAFEERRRPLIVWLCSEIGARGTQNRHFLRALIAIEFVERSKGTQHRPYNREEKNGACAKHCLQERCHRLWQ